MYNKMTEQDLYNNIEYKMATNSLKRQHQWIKGFEPYNDINKYSSMISLDVIVDFDLLAKTYNWTFNKWVHLEDGYDTPTLIMVFKEGRSIIKPLEDKLNYEFSLMHNTNLIPDDMRLPKELHISGFKSYPTT